MRARFISNLTILIVGALLMGSRFAFSTGTTGWLSFAGGCWAVVISALALPSAGRGRFQRSLDLCLVIIGAWTVISALTYGGRVVGWLAFANGAALAALALVGLIAHEHAMETGVRAAANRTMATGPRVA